MHYHKEMTQFFFVESGVLSIESAGRIRVLKPCEGITFKGNEKHRVHNSHDEVAEYLVSERYVDDCATYYD